MTVKNLHVFAGIAILSFTSTLLPGCGKQPAQAMYDIVPLPVETVYSNDEGFLLDRSVIIYTYSTDNGLKNASFLSDYINDVCGFRPTIIASPDLHVTQDNSGKPIVLTVDSSAGHPDGYRLEVGPEKITIAGSSDAGVFYGIQSLRKSMPVAVAGKVEFPAVIITDYPRFPHRGFMLDAARSFFTVDQVKEYLDMLALHNLNIFHWHLTDDQGWRIEIDAYPELTRIGAFRADSTGSYGGYYTKAEIRDIIDYAADRYIEVIPEIDLPGHMTAAIATYPELGCTGGPYEITSIPGVRRDILCAGNPDTYLFLENVLAEVAELFPSKYIHIGGDESPRTRWISCPKCQAKIRMEGLHADRHHSAEDYLQGYMNIYVEKFLREHGKTIIGWDEIVEGGLSPEATVMSWRGMEGGETAAKAGHDVIMSPTSHLYFDYYQSQDVDNQPVAFGGYVPMERVYSFDPVPASLTDEEKKHIIGLQANLWSPWLRDYKVAQYMTLPRMAALAEVAWSYSTERDFADFASRLQNLTAIYDNEGYTYRKEFFEITPSYSPDYDNRTLLVTLQANPSATIYYTTDGSEPGKSSQVYTAPVRIAGDAVLKAVAILPGSIKSALFTEEIEFNKATLRPFESFTEPDASYSNLGLLNDGVKGKTVYGLGGWVGYRGAPMNITIDLQEPMTVSGVTAFTLSDFGSHILDATSMTVSVSTDNQNFTQVASDTFDEHPFDPKKILFDHTVDFPATEARYVNIVMDCQAEMPPAQYDPGIVPFMFVSEITIR